MKQTLEDYIMIVDANGAKFIPKDLKSKNSKKKISSK